MGFALSAGLTVCPTRVAVDREIVAHLPVKIMVIDGFAPADVLVSARRRLKHALAHGDILPKNMEVIQCVQSNPINQPA